MEDITGSRQKKPAWRGGPNHPRRGGPQAPRHHGRGRGTLPPERGGLHRGRGSRPETRPRPGHPSSHQHTIAGAKRTYRDTAVKYGARSSLKPKPFQLSNGIHAAVFSGLQPQPGFPPISPASSMIQRRKNTSRLRQESTSFPWTVCVRSPRYALQRLSGPEVHGPSRVSLCVHHAGATRAGGGQGICGDAGKAHSP